MASAGRIKIGESIAVISEPPGVVAGLPSVGHNVLLPLIAGMWSENSLSLGALNSGITDIDLALISRKTDQNIYTGRLVNQSLLGFPLAMRIILLISFLGTVFLVIFLILNFRQDTITIIQSRLKKLQVNLLAEYYEHTGDLNWSHWRRELEHRREDVHAELKRGLIVRVRGFAEIDNFIDRSWDDLVAIIGGRMEKRFEIDEDTLRALLSRLLPETAAQEGSAGTENSDVADKPEALEALNEADIVEALEGPAREQALLEAPEPELEELDAGEAELVELEADEVDEPEELEALDEADEVEELEDPAGEEAAPEAPKPDLEELAVVEPELVEPDGAEAPDRPAGEEPEAADEVEELEAVEPDRMRFDEIDPLEFDESAEFGTAIDSLVSAIEFSPESQELEREKEEEARSMAENFDIQSPFASIFSALAKEELEPEPVEELESLEREAPSPDESPETDAEELRLSFAGPQLSVPFLGTLNSEIAFLMAGEGDAPAAPEEDAAVLDAGPEPGDMDAGGQGTGPEPEETETDGGIITERDGVLYINENVLNPGKKILKGLNRNFKNLIDSILNNS
jgi:hypothetical protein